MGKNRYLTQNQLNRIYRRDKFICRYCGTYCENRFHLDHVYPLSKGGENSVENIVISCPSCNMYKHDKVGIWPKPVGYWDNPKLDKEKENFILNVIFWFAVPILVILLYVLFSIPEDVAFVICSFSFPIPFIVRYMRLYHGIEQNS